MTTSQTDRAAAAVRRLRRAGLRNTAARRGVLDQLAHAIGGRGHLTVTELHRALLARGLSVELSTVHRVLRQLVALGTAHTVPVGRTTTFGLADDAHHHAVCGTCGDMRQLPVEAVDAGTAAARAFGIDPDPPGQPNGVVVYGRCAECRALRAAALANARLDDLTDAWELLAQHPPLPAVVDTDLHRLQVVGHRLRQVFQSVTTGGEQQAVDELNALLARYRAHPMISGTSAVD
ncbi:Fur family transcriptional regulator [Micromonospora endophytica]|uniref:Fur family transcriptional regulator n=1 Tax=Micromonospora endophytica TaxID=515350 RepID=UPI001C3222BF|nr:hypothetical protein Jiend_18100 [Micromonospora endophytica]